jgi:hypothetical protein
VHTYAIFAGIRNDVTNDDCVLIAVSIISNSVVGNIGLPVNAKLGTLVYHSHDICNDVLCSISWRIYRCDLFVQ